MAVQSLWMGHPVKDPPIELILSRLMKSYPGYTAQALLDEDEEIVSALLAIENAEAKMQEVQNRRNKARSQRR